MYLRTYLADNEKNDEDIKDIAQIKIFLIKQSPK